MAVQKRPSSRAIRSAAAGSWVALVALTTLGDRAEAVRAEVQADDLSDEAYRLVVQSYEASDGAVPGRDVRPVGSVQRAVTADELKRGVHIDLLELRKGAAAEGPSGPVVVAWVEVGEPNLEFDGLTARPAPGSMYGVVKRGAMQDVVRISLNRKVDA